MGVEDAETAEKPKFEITLSPEGKECVGMIVEGEKWILLGSYGKSEAKQQEAELQRTMFPYKKGTPYNWKRSIEEGELVPYDEKLVAEKELTGVYVQESDFDEIVNTGMRASD